MNSRIDSIIIHLTWGTRDRRRLLVGEVEKAVHATIVAKARQFRCEVLALGGSSDHVHVLLSLNPSVLLADVVRHMKGASSHLANHAFATGGFAWQEGYAALSVDHRNYEPVRQYILGQREHHQSDACPGPSVTP